MELEKEEKGNEVLKPILLEDLGYLYPNEESKQLRKFGLYKCGFCGTEFKALVNNINRGHTKSCGCHKSKILKEGTNKKHGLRGSKLYRTWAGMKNRIINIKDKDYQNYGGRGINICEEWKNDFKTFYDWAMLNGYEQEVGLTLDRINVNGDYCPENCRWTTKLVQARNKRISKNNTTGYKGVSYNKAYKKFVALLQIKPKPIFLGYFKTAVEGAIAYNNYIIENKLEGFILNEIPSQETN